MSLIILGLSVHMTQVHKESISSIDNALPNRSGIDLEIFGMEGIPDDIRQAHQQRVLQHFAQTEADRRGNSGAGGGAGANGAKKTKFESPAEIKMRLAEHKARVAAEQAAGGSGLGEASPMEDLGQSPGYMPNQGFVSWITLSYN